MKKNEASRSKLRSKVESGSLGRNVSKQEGTGPYHLSLLAHAIFKRRFARPPFKSQRLRRAWLHLILEPRDVRLAENYRIAGTQECFGDAG